MELGWDFQSFTFHYDNNLEVAPKTSDWHKELKTKKHQRPCSVINVYSAQSGHLDNLSIYKNKTKNTKFYFILTKHKDVVVAQLTKIKKKNKRRHKET